MTGKITVKYWCNGKQNWLFGICTYRMSVTGLYFWYCSAPFSLFNTFFATVNNLSTYLISSVIIGDLAFVFIRISNQHTVSPLNPLNSVPFSHFEGRKGEGSKWNWIKKQIEPFCFQFSKCRIFFSVSRSFFQFVLEKNWLNSLLYQLMFGF